MKYEFKFAEIGWFLLVTAVVELAQVLAAFDPEAITDWEKWAVSVASGLVRVTAAAVITVVTRSKVS